MKVLVNLFQFDANYWYFEKIFQEYPQITEMDYIRYHNVRSINWRSLMPSAKKALKKFGKQDIDWRKLSLYDKRRYEIFYSLPCFAIIAFDSLEWNIKNIEHKKNTSKRWVILLYYFYLWKLQDYDALFVYNGKKTEQQTAIAAAKFLNKKIVYFEVGPLKNTVTIDTNGVNYENSLPHDIEFYRNWAKNNPNPLKKAKIDIRDKKYQEFISHDKPELETPYIFLPLQVFTDTQILFFSDWVENVPSLIEIGKRMSELLPTGWRILMKEHPTCEARYPPQHITAERLVLANGHSTPDLIQNAALILTLNSSVGLEAMMFNKPVITLGKAFYAFGGLTHQCFNEEELTIAIKNPKSVSFSQTDREAFLNYLMNDYYIDGNIDKHLWLNSEKNKRLIQKELGLEWRQKEKYQTGQKKNLVIVAVYGAESYHEEILREGRNWDMLVCDVSEIEVGKNQYDVDGVIYFNNNGGGRFDSIHKAFEENPHLLEQYDYVMMVENHIEVDYKTINRCFDLMAKYGLQLASPSFSNKGHARHFVLRHNPKFKLRYTNYIDREIVCMDMKLWKKILPLYKDNPNAYHIELFWNRFADDPKTQIAVLDEIQCYRPFWCHQIGFWQDLQEKHLWEEEGPIINYVPRHLKDSNRQVLRPMRRSNLWWVVQIVCHAGIMADGTRINSRNEMSDILLNQGLGYVKKYVPRIEAYPPGSLEELQCQALHYQKNSASRLGRLDINYRRRFTATKFWKTIRKFFYKKNPLLSKHISSEQ